MSSEGDEWRTPRYVFYWMARRFPFAVDLAASDDNALCSAYYTPAIDSLAQRWADEPGGFGWCNPPYSDPAPFLHKAQDEAALGFTTVLLVPAPNGEVYLGRHVFGVASEVILISGRLSFTGSNGEPVNGNRIGSMIVIYEAHNLGDTHFRHVFRDQIPGAPPKRQRKRAG